MNTQEIYMHIMMVDGGGGFDISGGVVHGLSFGCRGGSGVVMMVVVVAVMVSLWHD